MTSITYSQEAFTEYDECENCGMVDVPMVDGFCEGCICDRCGKNAGETGCSMNDMGWCNACEALLQETLR